LVLENAVNGQCFIWVLNNGAAQNAIMLPTLSAGWQIAGAADFDSDGRADLVLQNTISGQRLIWTLNSSEQPSSTTSLPTISTQWSIVDH
jgi:hypothetical protein